jgi:hypothetical protein
MTSSGGKMAGLLRISGSTNSLAASLHVAYRLKFVSSAWISGRWMKSSHAYAAFGCGASASMTQVSIQKSVPSDGTEYPASPSVTRSASSWPSGPVQPSVNDASPVAILSP